MLRANEKRDLPESVVISIATSKRNKHSNVELMILSATRRAHNCKAQKMPLSFAAERHFARMEARLFT
jgi:hypothetical protein